MYCVVALNRLEDENHECLVIKSIFHYLFCISKSNQGGAG